MSVSHFGRIQKAVALVPLALLSTAWTVNLASTGHGDDPGAAIEDGTAVPTQTIDDPASYSVPGRISLGVPKGEAGQVVATASANGIPTAALAAYQRAETVINAADKSCHLPWELLAAIGRVESDHGRYGGNVLGTDGVARPGIYGIALNGTHRTVEVLDTDAGQYDNDSVYDRAVGPMQFIPSTWAVVGVDADGDGQRNPQDIDDASLAAAVYLCSGEGDLGLDSGRRAAVYRYNHSTAYVNLVLALMDAYMAGDYSAVPNYTTSAVTFTPDFNYTGPHHFGGGHHHHGTKGGGGNTTPPPPVDPDPTPDPDPDPTPTVDDPVKSITDTVKQVQDTVKNTVDNTVKNVNQVLTLAEATVQCTLKGYSALLTPVAWKQCIADLTTP